VEHLEHAVELEPDDYGYYLVLGNACLLVPSLEDNYSERAVETLEKAASIAPDLPDAWMALAETYRKAGNLDKAASCCDRAIEIARQNDSGTGQSAPLILRAEIALRSGEPQEAFNLLQEAMKVSGEDQEDLHPILLLSRALDNLERPAEALAALETALPKAQEPLPLLLERVRLLRRSLGLPAALEALKDILQHYPEEPVVLAALARAQAEAGQVEASTANAQRALLVEAKQSDLGAKQDGPSRGDTLLTLDVESQADLHLLLGRLLRQSGQLDQALHHLNESIEKNPRMLDPYLELGRVLQERRQVSQALQVYNRATSIAPRDPRPYYQAGLALKEGKDYMGAEAMFRRAASLAPNDLGIHRQLGAVVALNLVHNRRRSSLDV
jgi:tetratricopeptide (TPR) repeat protein